jgi:hypothetical protein
MTELLTVATNIISVLGSGGTVGYGMPVVTKMLYVPFSKLKLL